MSLVCQLYPNHLSGKYYSSSDDVISAIDVLFIKQWEMTSFNSQMSVSVDLNNAVIIVLLNNYQALFKQYL